MKRVLLILQLLLWVLVAPWVLLVAVVRFVFALLRFPGRVAVRLGDTLPCPVGHPNPLQGRWTCSCGANYLGHAFAPCPICNLPAGFIRCETCGLAIRSPWKSP